MRYAIVLELEVENWVHAEQIASALAKQADGKTLMVAQRERFTCEEKIA